MKKRKGPDPFALTIMDTLPNDVSSASAGPSRPLRREVAADDELRAPAGNKSLEMQPMMKKKHLSDRKKKTKPIVKMGADLDNNNNNKMGASMVGQVVGEQGATPSLKKKKKKKNGPTSLDVTTTVLKASSRLKKSIRSKLKRGTSGRSSSPSYMKPISKSQAQFNRPEIDKGVNARTPVKLEQLTNIIEERMQVR